MHKTYIDALSCADTVTQALRRGVFLNTAAGEKRNCMVIGWGELGRVWELPVFIAYVRQNRYTHELLEQNGEFTVCVPVNGYEKQAFAVCGGRSGRDLDKFTAAPLTAVEAEKVLPCAIREFPLTLECRVIYRETEETAKLPEEIRKRFYSVETEAHTAYYGQIVSAYLLEED